MASSSTDQPSSRWWYLLLALPWIAIAWVPSYNRIEPKISNFPFFYWYQLAWVAASAIVTAIVYFKTVPIEMTGKGVES
jgi:hypothetical protein